ncbi:MAG: methyltransferase domain-containing protein [Tardiphaga sp.]
MSTMNSTMHAATDLSRRSTEAEWLDTADTSPQELEAVLRDLARFNGAMLGRQAVINWLDAAVARIPQRTQLTLIDVGCGYGDLLRAIRSWADKRGLNIRLIGLDVSRETVRIAQNATNEELGIEYRVMDVFDFTPPAPVDFVVSSLLTHHMSDELIVTFLRWMERTAHRGWVIYDLQRHQLPFHFIGLVGRLTRLHPIVVHDGRISVARSLTRAEWIARLREAGIALKNVRLRWFLFRFVIGRVR